MSDNMKLKLYKQRRNDLHNVNSIENKLIIQGLNRIIQKLEYKLKTI